MRVTGERRGGGARRRELPKGEERSEMSAPARAVSSGGKGENKDEFCALAFGVGKEQHECSHTVKICGP